MKLLLKCWYHFACRNQRKEAKNGNSWMRASTRRNGSNPPVDHPICLHFSNNLRELVSLFGVYQVLVKMSHNSLTLTFTWGIVNQMFCNFHPCKAWNKCLDCACTHCCPLPHYSVRTCLYCKTKAASSIHSNNY